MSETEILIDLVKERRFLYDLDDPDYKNRAKRLETWNEIAVEMGAGDANIWNAKWKGLRDNYAKFKKTSDPTTGAAYKKYKNWPWAELMKFLDDCNSFASRRLISYTSSNTNCSNTNSNMVTNNDPVQDPFCSVQLFVADCNITSPGEELQDPVPEGSEHFVPEVKKRKIKSRPEPIDELHQEYFKMKRNEQSSPRLDGVDHFFLSYAQSFKKLPSRMQIMLKLEIATLFSRYELQAEGVTSDSINSISRIVPHPVKSEYDFTNTIEDS